MKLKELIKKCLEETKDHTERIDFEISLAGDGKELYSADKGDTKIRFTVEREKE